MKVFKLTIEIEYECPETKFRYQTIINNPQINHGYRFEDDQYEYFYVKCDCGKEHKVEL
jgi:hypothetical protein